MAGFRGLQTGFLIKNTGGGGYTGLKENMK